jgi:predicted negative regulator of RcsB-dependent stress response
VGKERKSMLAQAASTKIWINAIAGIKQMLKRIWQWLKALFGRLFGGANHSDSRRDSFASSREQNRQGASSTIGNTPAPKSLDDSDYEYLFRQLLEGVAHSWQQERIVRWFEGLKGRITYQEWLGWLRRFGERVLASPAPNSELAMRLVIIGEQILPVPSLQEIGEATYDIGRQLLSRETSGVIWEYEGPDADATAPSSPLPPPPQQGEVMESEDGPVVQITLDELFERMQQDPSLVQMIAQQVGIEATDPQAVIQAVINQINAVNEAALSEAETWFTQGVYQQETGNLEEALASYDKALELRPDLYGIWFNRANALSDLQRLEEALASYDKALEFKPDLYEGWYNRGNALYNLGRMDEATASYNKAQEIKGSNPPETTT